MSMRCHNNRQVVCFRFSCLRLILEKGAELVDSKGQKPILDAGTVVLARGEETKRRISRSIKTKGSTNIHYGGLH